MKKSVGSTSRDEA